MPLIGEPEAYHARDQQDCEGLPIGRGQLGQERQHSDLRCKSDARSERAEPGIAFA